MRIVYTCVEGLPGRLQADMDNGMLQPHGLATEQEPVHGLGGGSSRSVPRPDPRDRHRPESAASSKGPPPWGQNRMKSRVPSTTTSSLLLSPELTHCTSAEICTAGVIAKL